MKNSIELKSCLGDQLSRLLREYMIAEESGAALAAQKAELKAKTEELAKTHENILMLIGRCLSESEQFDKKLLVKLDDKAFCVQASLLAGHQHPLPQDDLRCVTINTTLRQRCIVWIDEMDLVFSEQDEHGGQP